MWQSLLKFELQDQLDHFKRKSSFAFSWKDEVTTLNCVSIENNVVAAQDPNAIFLEYIGCVPAFTVVDMDKAHVDFDDVES